MKAEVANAAAAGAVSEQRGAVVDVAVVAELVEMEAVAATVVTDAEGVTAVSAAVIMRMQAATAETATAKEVEVAMEALLLLLAVVVGWN